jgi:ubiquinone/menaquinone biosynthesis C-methylase UbiE
MEQGENISALLRKEKDLAINTEEIIEIAYDLQAGSYIEALEKTKHAEQMLRCYRAIAELLKNYCHFSSILEAGVGEATTLSGVLANLEQKVQAYGFDLSWSRIAHARSYMNSKGLSSDGLCTGNLLNIPFADNSVDLVYTCHSIEPNGGNEEPILAELYRVCR